eukprot:s2043_g4.t4
MHPAKIQPPRTQEEYRRLEEEKKRCQEEEVREVQLRLKEVMEIQSECMDQILLRGDEMASPEKFHRTAKKSGGFFGGMGRALSGAVQSLGGSSSKAEKCRSTAPNYEPRSLCLDSAAPRSRRRLSVGAAPTSSKAAVAPPVEPASAEAPEPQASQPSEPSQAEAKPKTTQQPPSQPEAVEESLEARDYTQVPKQLDEQFEKLDPDSSLRPTIINPGSTWSKRSQAALLAAAQTRSLASDEQKREKDAAFDLLDAITKSGALPLSHAELHIIVAATHCFDKTVTETVVQDNVNPIAKVERSSLIMASTVHQQPAECLMNESCHARAASAFAGQSSVPTEAAYSSIVQCEDVRRKFFEALLSDADRHALQKELRRARANHEALTVRSFVENDTKWFCEQSAMAVVFGRKGQSKLKAAGSRPSRPSEEDGIGRGRACIEHVPKLPIQSACSGRPKIFLEIAIFRGAFFGVDHQQALEFELYPEAAPKAARRLLEDCAAGRLSDRRLTQITPTSALLDGAELGEPETETGKGLPHTDPGMLSVSRNVDFAGYILTLAPAPRLDRDHAAVGRLITSSAFLDHIVSARDSTCKEVRVVNCGEAVTVSARLAPLFGQQGPAQLCCSWFPSIGGECLCLMAIRFSDACSRLGELPDTGDPEEDQEADVHELTVGTAYPFAVHRTSAGLEDILGEALLGEGFALRLSEKSEQQGLQQWFEFFPFNTCVGGYTYTECVDLPAVALEIFADAACTTKMTEIIVPHVDCRTPDDRASSKTELVDGSSDCMGNTVGNITAEIPGKFEDGPEWFKLEEQYTRFTSSRCRDGQAVDDRIDHNNHDGCECVDDLGDLGHEHSRRVLSNSAASPSRGQRVFGPVRLRTRATSWDVTREGGNHTVTVVLTWCTGEVECSECLAQLKIFVLSQAVVSQEDARWRRQGSSRVGAGDGAKTCDLLRLSAAFSVAPAKEEPCSGHGPAAEVPWLRLPPRRPPAPPRPPSSSDNSCKALTGDGRKFFHNEETGVSQWEKPDSLMTDSERIVNSTAWKQYRIWDGRIFYHNKETKVSCWSMPPELRKLRGESTGLDDRPLPETLAEQRQAFQELLKERQVDATWDWRRVQELARDAPQAEGVSEPVQKQVFAELLSLALKRTETEARAKARNAAVALERLVEERFADPDALGTTYEEAARILGDEEAWTLIKSDVRRDEVFQTVMERLEEKHEKHRADKRAERVVRLQRLMATDPELRRPRMRWKDATAVLARRDELQEEEPPIEALRVWASMRELRQPATREVDPKNKAQADFFRDERKRRDAFVLSMKELAAAERFTMGTSWAQLEEMLQASGDQRIAGLREGEGAVAMELFDEFVEELKLKGAEAYAGVEPAPPPPEPIVGALLSFGHVSAGKPEDENQRAASANPRCELRSTEELLLAAPKVELHVHLDGSFDAGVLFRAAQAHLEELPEKVRTPWDGKMLEVRKAVRECHGDLAKFTSLVGSDIIGLFPILDCFYTFLPIVRGRLALLEELAFEFCRERKKHNIIYTEVRYSPFEFLPQGEDGQIADTSKAADAVKAVCAGLQKGQAEFGVTEFRNEGVVGVDIAAGEMHFEEGALHDAHRDAMAMAQKKGLGITVHAAEAGPGDNVCRAMDVYGASRIGHGYRSVGMQAYDYARSKGVHFELCPTSSVSTQAIELDKADGSLQWKTHPISRFFLDGTSCSINSDDPAVFRSSLTDELVICVKEMGLSLENIQWMTLEALEHAFHLESGVKDTIAEKVKAFYEQTLN